MKTTRRAGRFAGRIIDDEDRRFLGQAFVLAASGGALIIGSAGAIGLAVRLFGIAAG